MPTDTIRGTGTLGALLWIAIAAGCSSSGDGAEDLPSADSTSTVRDSAGIRIVENLHPLRSSDSPWEIDPSPVLEVGNGQDGLIFGRIGQAILGENGRIAVVDGMSSEIIVLNPDGSLFHKIGREGEGPGEFRSPPTIAWSGPNELAAWDAESRRVTWFDDRGELVRERSLQVALGDLMTISGMWMMSGNTDLLGADARLNRREEDGRSVYRYAFVPALGESVVDAGDYLGPPSIRQRGWGWQVSSVLVPQPIVRLGAEGGRGYVVDSGRWEVRFVDLQVGARATHMVRIAQPRVPVTEEMLEVIRDTWRERAGDRVPRSTYVDAFDRLEVPDSLPAIRSLQIDQVGRIWVGRRATAEPTVASDYVVLDASGVWLANATAPEGMGYLTGIADDVVLVSARGPLDEPLLRIHRILR